MEGRIAQETMRHAHKSLVRKPEGINRLGNFGIDVGIVLKWILKK
jgi:hypothetical protein